MNDTTQIHDFNPGFGPEVSTVDSGNGFGTRVFWTAVIPDSDVQIDPGAGTAEMHVQNLAEFNYFAPGGGAGNVSLGPNWQTAAIDATVSFDVVWNGPVTRDVRVRDKTYGFAGHFLENQATVSWSAQNSSGFSFTSNPGDFSTSLPEVPGVNGVTQPLNFFAEIGRERNGIFFPQGDDHGDNPEGDHHGDHNQRDNSEGDQHGDNSAVSIDALVLPALSNATPTGAPAVSPANTSAANRADGLPGRSTGLTLAIVTVPSPHRGSGDSGGGHVFVSAAAAAAGKHRAVTVDTVFASTDNLFGPITPI